MGPLFPQLKIAPPPPTAIEAPQMGAQYEGSALNIQKREKHSRTWDSDIHISLKHR